MKDMSVGVYLVGAGPGDPDLLTVKALRLIQSVDVVVYDRLISQGILDLIPAGTTQIFAGKAPDRHTLPQSEINTLLLRLAKAGYRVVRLKGGDPNIFGRGAEEADFLAANGIACEMVPGITAAAGTSASARVPLTYRGLATGVRFVTGHRCDGSDLDLNWQSLADPDTTLVVYMGVRSLPATSANLIAAGLDPDTPAVMVENATTEAERVIKATLATLPEMAIAADVKPPLLTIIGRVAGLDSVLETMAPDCPENWTEARGA